MLGLIKSLKKSEAITIITENVIISNNENNYDVNQLGIYNDIANDKIVNNVDKIKYNSIINDIFVNKILHDNSLKSSFYIKPSEEYSELTKLALEDKKILNALECIEPVLYGEISTEKNKKNFIKRKMFNIENNVKIQNKVLKLKLCLKQVDPFLFDDLFFENIEYKIEHTQRGLSNIMKEINDQDNNMDSLFKKRKNNVSKSDFVRIMEQELLTEEMLLDPGLERIMKKYYGHRVNNRTLYSEKSKRKFYLKAIRIVEQNPERITGTDIYHLEKLNLSKCAIFEMIKLFKIGKNRNNGNSRTKIFDPFSKRYEKIEI